MPVPGMCPVQGAEVGQRLQAAAGQEPSLAQLFEGVDLNDSVAAGESLAMGLRSSAMGECFMVHHASC